jgi:glycosyltransferase involved in cell wall biosynthesis
MIKMILSVLKILSGFGFTRKRLIKKSLGLLQSMGLSLPRISVVVVNYNYGHYLTERLDSIIAQSIGIYEIILVDDASEDNSMTVLKDWMSTHNINITIVRNEYNSGSVFGQWIKGITAATGDFVWIAEADDLCEIKFLETVLPPLLNDRSIVLSYCESRQMDGRGTFYADNYDSYLRIVSETLWTTDRIADGTYEITHALAILNSIPNVSSILFRREYLADTVQQYSADIISYKIAADYALYVRLLSFGKMAYSRANLNIHRRHPDSIIAKCQRKDLHQEIISIQQWVMDRYSLPSSTSRKIDDYRKIMLDEVQ